MGERPDKMLPPTGQSDIDTICDEFEATLKAGKRADLAAYLNRARPSDRPALRRALQSIQALHLQTVSQKAIPAKDPALREFVRTLVASQLMSKAESEAFQASLPKDEQPQTAEEFAKALYRHQRLTRFQTQAIFQGKTKGLVFGNYVVLDKIGQGGMGYVYKAQHKRMKRTVAVKVLPSQVSRQKEAVERFHREVVAAARLSHPNIVTAHDADEADGVHFLVMEFVEGNDLTKLVRSKGTLSVAKALDYVAQAANGLQYAHEQGVVHRDIKPSNLLLDHSGTLKILDMGLARFERELQESSGGQSLTQDGQVMGTLDYMAPEQALDTHHADARADIYSLGCTLYFLLTGKPVFPGQTMATKILAHREQPVPSLRDARSDVSETLDRVFQQMLAKRPEDRQHSMDQVTRELDACRGSGEELHETASISAGPTGGGPTLTYARDMPDAPVTPPPLPAPPGSGKSGPSDWLKQKIPELPTVFRSTVKRSKKRDLLLTSSIATGTLLIVLLAAYMMNSPNQATLLVYVNEPDATILVLDGEDRVVTKKQSGLEATSIHLPPGTHELRVEKSGFEALSKQFQLETGTEQTVRVRLTPLRLEPSAEETSDVIDAPMPAMPGPETVHVPAVAPPPSQVTTPEPEPTTIVDRANDSEQRTPPNIDLEKTTSLPPPLAAAPFDALRAREYQRAWSSHLHAPVKWTNTIGMEFALIPPGEFQMGSMEDEESRYDYEGPQHRVRFANPFYLGAYEVTQEQYEQIMGVNPSFFARRGKTKIDLSGLPLTRFPVENVSWEEATEFCHRLSQKEKLHYRLPTEAEWEFACRAGTSTPFYFGRSLFSATDGNYDGTQAYAGGQEGPNLKRTTAVGSYRANAWGLHDMHGNVWEWCRDWYSRGSYETGQASDPVGPATGSYRVNRGGSWFGGPASCRSASRSWVAPTFRGGLLGLRVVLASSAQE